MNAGQEREREIKSRLKPEVKGNPPALNFDQHEKNCVQNVRDGASTAMLCLFGASFSSGTGQISR
jgi:hypothetical protein